MQIVGKRSEYLLLGLLIVSVAQAFGVVPPEVSAKLSALAGPLVENPTFSALGYTLLKHFENR